jgi:hypothetical protein
MQSEESVIKVAIDRLISKNQEHTMPLNVIKSFLDAKS